MEIQDQISSIQQSPPSYTPRQNFDPFQTQDQIDSYRALAGLLSFAFKNTAYQDDQIAGWFAVKSTMNTMDDAIIFLLKSIHQNQAPKYLRDVQFYDFLQYLSQLPLQSMTDQQIMITALKADHYFSQGKTAAAVVNQLQVQKTITLPLDSQQQYVTLIGDIFDQATQNAIMQTIVQRKQDKRQSYQQIQKIIQKCSTAQGCIAAMLNQIMQLVFIPDTNWSQRPIKQLSNQARSKYDKWLAQYSQQLVAARQKIQTSQFKAFYQDFTKIQQILADDQQYRRYFQQLKGNFLIQGMAQQQAQQLILRFKTLIGQYQTAYIKYNDTSQKTKKLKFYQEKAIRKRLSEAQFQYVVELIANQNQYEVIDSYVLQRGRQANVLQALQKLVQQVNSKKTITQRSQKTPQFCRQCLQQVITQLKQQAQKQGLYGSYLKSIITDKQQQVCQQRVKQFMRTFSNSKTMAHFLVSLNSVSQEVKLLDQQLKQYNHNLAQFTKQVKNVSGIDAQKVKLLDATLSKQQQTLTTTCTKLNQSLHKIDHLQRMWAAFILQSFQITQQDQKILQLKKPTLTQQQRKQILSRDGVKNYTSTYIMNSQQGRTYRQYVMHRIAQNTAIQKINHNIQKAALKVFKSDIPEQYRDWVIQASQIYKQHMLSFIKKQKALFLLNTSIYNRADDSKFVQKVKNAQQQQFALFQQKLDKIVKFSQAKQPQVEKIVQGLIQDDQKMEEQINEQKIKEDDNNSADQVQ